MELIPSRFPHIKVCGPSDKIYKDECVCSYHTPESEGGLYINLRNFEAVGEEFLDYHFERHGFSVYLNHKRFKYKIDKPESSETKPKRLAIGLESGFDPDGSEKDFRFEDSYSVVLMPERIHIPVPNQDLPYLLNESVEAIFIKQSTETEVASTGVWDGEQRKVSKFAENLEQLENPPKIPPTGWKCQKCDLKENLWLNITDGTILCGRRFYDGSGGNNHAVQHYEECKYPLAVKLGTITSGSADVYSYPEEDMVIDPHLDKHLAHFGIDVTKLAKTEKSMIELEIDMNQKIGEWSLIQEEGKNLELVYGPSFTGIANLGNSCYMNSVLQVLFSIEEFQNRYTPAQTIYHSCNTIGDFNHQMAKLAYGLLSGKYSVCDKVGKEQKGIKPRSFKHFVCKNDPNFSTARQQDAHEFYLFLVDLLEKNSDTRDPAKYNPSKCFECVIEDRIECSQSHKVKYKYRSELCLSLTVDLDLATNKAEVEAYKSELDKKISPEPELVRPKIPLPSLIDLFAKAEVITEFYSTAIQGKTSAEKTSKISKFPRILVLQIKKFCYAEDWTPKKMDIAVDVPDLLDLDHLEGIGIQMTETELEDSDDQGNQEKTSEGASSSAPMTAGSSSGASVASPAAVEPDSEAIATLISMGIDVTQAVDALKLCNNDAQRAIDYIFDPDSFIPPNLNAIPLGSESTAHTSSSASRLDPQWVPGSRDPDAKLYQLKAFISHMGTSTSCGHYVCHVRREEKWYIFNDNKIAISENPPKEFGYLYFYERVRS